MRANYHEEHPVDLSAFKAYDIRGRIPDQLNVDLAEQIGLAYAAWLKPRNVVVGHDIRLTSPELTEAVISGLRKAGVHCHFIGECGTEEIYFATDHFEMDGGIMVTASHNPKDYNGMKFVREQSRPVSGDDGLGEIRALVASGQLNVPANQAPGTRSNLDHRPAYIDHLLQYVDAPSLKPLRIVTNAGHGGAGTVIDALEPHLPIEFIKIHHEPNGHFPEGVPNPLLIENRAPTIEAIRSSKADFGIAWDGDFDRCFFFDHEGRFIEGYYMVGLLAASFLEREPGAAIAYDPRLTWNTEDIVREAGGRPIMSKTGHAFFKATLRHENAIYGGEMSAHHYFRDFASCDSGMIPWLLVAEMMSKRDQSLAELVDARMARYPASGEINRKVEDASATISEIRAAFEGDAEGVDTTDGISLSFADWRFNLRMSNTEPVIRLNVESRGDVSLMEERTEMLLGMIGGDLA